MPLVKVYTGQDCRRLFKDFQDVKISPYHFRTDQIPIPIINRLLPTFLPPCFGWYIFAEGIKRD
jgi:hypothetical protein